MAQDTLDSSKCSGVLKVAQDTLSSSNTLYGIIIKIGKYTGAGCP